MTDLSAIHMTAHREMQPKVGISACLSGREVRYDGDHKYHELIMRELGPWLDLLLFCPEVDAELGIPRPPVHLAEQPNGQLRALGVEDTRLDVTDALQCSAHQFATQRAHELCAYIVKSRSPSCGAGSTPIIKSGNSTSRDGDGLLVSALKAACPGLLIVEERELDSVEKCRAFLEQCYLLSER
ncbi:2-thiouracil desulfurase family protein [Porticoccus sp.]